MMPSSSFSSLRAACLLPDDSGHNQQLLVYIFTCLLFSAPARLHFQEGRGQVGFVPAVSPALPVRQVLSEQLRVSSE